MTRSVNDPVDDARRAAREVTPQMVARPGHDALLIDVREPHEYAIDHIENAINIPRGVLEFQIDGHPALAEAGAAPAPIRARRITLYCRSGARSALAALTLQQLGFEQVESIAGGIVAWREAGLPVASS